MPRVNYIQESPGSDKMVELDYHRAKLGIEQFGGSLYALGPYQCEHAWGLLTATSSLCNRRIRDHTETRYKTGQICAFCLKLLPPIIGPMEGEC